MSKSVQNNYVYHQPSTAYKTWHLPRCFAADILLLSTRLFCFGLLQEWLLKDLWQNFHKVQVVGRDMINRFCQWSVALPLFYSRKTLKNLNYNKTQSKICKTYIKKQQVLMPANSEWESRCTVTLQKRQNSLAFLYLASTLSRSFDDAFSRFIFSYSTHRAW